MRLFWGVCFGLRASLANSCDWLSHERWEPRPLR
jgi:hypothetical protein